MDGMLKMKGKKIRKPDASPVGVMPDRPLEMPFESDDDAPYMTTVELRTLDMYIYQRQASEAIRDKFSTEEKLLMIEYVSNRDTIRKKQADAEASRLEAIRNYNSFREGIQKRLGINLDHYTVSETGRLTLIVDPASGVADTNMNGPG